MPVIPGLYQLLIRVERPVHVLAGSLGFWQLPAGWFVYTGSARKGLVQRVSRHLRTCKKIHWHIDYLLAVAESTEAFVLTGRRCSECGLHRKLSRGEVLIPGFGSSDCECRSHLAYFKRRPKISLLPWTEFIRKVRVADNERWRGRSRCVQGEPESDCAF